jgi:hypothetical protein
VAWSPGDTEGPDMGERLGGIYFSQDFPVLAEIGRWEAAGRPGRALDPVAVAERLGRPLEQVVQSVGRLYHAGLVDAEDATTFGGDAYIINRLTGAGLQESGLWPKPADLSDALEEAVKREIQATERSDPERSQKLRMVLDTLKEVGPQVIGRIVEAILKTYGGGK